MFQTYDNSNEAFNSIDITSYYNQVLLLDGSIEEQGNNKNKEHERVEQPAKQSKARDALRIARRDSSRSWPSVTKTELQTSLLIRLTNRLMFWKLDSKGYNSYEQLLVK
jgi:hypothetical protein